MNKTHDTQFSELVREKLASEEQARDLWIPIAEEFNRHGSEAAKEYLDAEQQRLKERVQNQLNQFDER